MEKHKAFAELVRRTRERFGCLSGCSPTWVRLFEIRDFDTKHEHALPDEFYSYSDRRSPVILRAVAEGLIKIRMVKGRYEYGS